MKKKFLLLVMLCLFIVFAFSSLSVSATDIIANGTYGENITWKLDDKGTLTIGGSGDIKSRDTYDTEAPWLKYINNIYKLIIEEGVTSIGARAFDTCHYLQTVILPQSVVSIDKDAFIFTYYINKVVYLGTEENWNIISYNVPCNNSGKICIGMSNYKEIDGVSYIVSNDCAIVESADKTLTGECIIQKTIDGIPVTTISRSAFRNCSNITSIEIPCGLTVIEEYAFAGCSNLSAIKIPSSVTTIKNRAFDDCWELNTLYIEDIESYLKINYEGAVSKPNSYNDYGAKLYINGKRAQNITIPKTVVQIPPYAFKYYESIESVCIEGDIESIGEGAFYYCRGLSSINLPDSITSIGSAAFQYCDNLTEINIPDNLTKIESYTFWHCDKLDNIELPYGVSSIGSGSFTGCKNIIIPNSVTTIEEHAFESGKFKSLIIPDSVTSIGQGAFSGCTSLESIQLSENLTSISDYLFADCYDLKSVIIPSKAKSIGRDTFRNCNLIEITIPHSVTEIEGGAFRGCYYLNTVNYNGDEETFSEIYVATEGNENFKNATKNYFWYVNLYIENGELFSTKRYSPNAVIDLSDVPQKEKHGIRVYADSDYTVVFEKNTPINGNTDLYFRYEQNEFVARFFNDNGELIKEYNVTSETEIPLPDIIPTKLSTKQYTYSFTGWDGYRDGMIMPYNNVYFTATYDATVNQYTYKFLDNDDTILKELKVDYGTVIEVPENPADKDPYTFDYWEGYQDGMELTDDISFKAVYKYKTYYVTVDGLDKVYDIVYNDAFELETQVPEEEYLFMGYYTEENGKGTRVTDENGVCIANYNFLTDITVYPYFPHELLNKIKINGEDSTVVGNSDVVKKVYFATDKVASYLLCTIKYPESITLKEIIEKDFVYISEESKTVTDGYVYQNLICQYTDNLDNLPYNKKVAPFELVFDIPTNTAPQNASIEITADSMLFGEEEYPFDYIINGNLEIAAKPVESIEISGQDEVVLEDGNVTYTAIITPDWATNPEVDWYVSDETIATISKDGVLTPASAGTVTITATAKDSSGVSAEKVITIKEFAKIKTLLSDIGQWDKEFDSNIREYTIYVPYDADSISFKPTFTSGRLTINNSLAVNNRYTSVKITEDSNVIFVRTNASGYANSEYKITIVRFEGTKTTVSEDGNSFAINPINIETGKTVILSLYEDGKFVETQTATYEGETLTFITDKAYTNAKVMVWGSLTNLKPVCKVETIE